MAVPTPSTLASELQSSEEVHKKPALVAWMARNRARVEQVCARGVADREKYRDAFDVVDMRALRFAAESASPTSGVPKVAVLPNPYRQAERTPEAVSYYRDQRYHEVAHKQEALATAAIRGQQRPAGTAKIRFVNDRDLQRAVAYAAVGRYVLTALDGVGRYRQRSGYDAWDAAVDLFYCVDLTEEKNDNLAFLWHIARDPQAVAFVPNTAAPNAPPVTTWLTGWTLHHCTLPNQTVDRDDERAFRDAIPAEQSYGVGPTARLLQTSLPRLDFPRAFSSDLSSKVYGAHNLVCIPRIAYFPSSGYFIAFEFCCYFVQKQGVYGVPQRTGAVIDDIRETSLNRSNIGIYSQGSTPLKLFRDYTDLVHPAYGPPLHTRTALPVDPELVEFGDDHERVMALIGAPLCSVMVPLTPKYLKVAENAWGRNGGMYVEHMLAAAGFREAKKPVDPTGAKAYHVTDWGALQIRPPANGKR